MEVRRNMWIRPHESDPRSRGDTQASAQNSRTFSHSAAPTQRQLRPSHGPRGWLNVHCVFLRPNSRSQR